MSLESSAFDVEPRNGGAPRGAVFLSYASQDAEAAKRICDSLRAAGVEVWFDQSELRGGDSWDRKIREQIKTCALFVPIISANTQTRGEGYFRLEWKLADRRTDLLGKSKAFLVPICIDDTTDADADVPDSFLAVQWMRLRDGVMDAASVDRIATLLHGEVARPSSVALPPHRSRETPPPPVSSANPSRWILIAASVVVVIAGIILFLKPWAKHDAAPSAGAPSVAPVSKARGLATRAREMIFSGAQTVASLEAAERLCEQALALDDTDADVWAIAADVDTLFVFFRFDASEKRKDQARRRSDQAMNLAPGSFEARFSRAMVYVHVLTDNSLKKDAETILRQLEREQPTDRSLLYQIGLLLRESGRFKEAAGYYERLGDDQGAGWNYAIAGMIDKSEAAVDRALQHDHPGDYAYVLKAVLLLNREDIERAYATLLRLPAASRLEDQFAYYTALYSLYRRQPEDALATMRAFPAEILTTRNGPVPRAAVTAHANEMAGRTIAAMADYRVALAQIEKLLADRPTDTFLLLSKAETQAALGDSQAAEATAKLAAELSGLDPREVTQQNATLFMRLGRKEEVLAWLETELRLGKTSIQDSYHWMARFDPAFNPLRGDPRFEKLLRETLPKGAKPFEDQKTEGREEKTAVVVPEKSVAVLAFTNLSDDKDNEYFSDGISEELLNVLAKVPGLKVTARTSSFHFKGKDTSIPEIAQQLGVAYVIEGSVRKQGDRVRITAQLIKAADGFHVWSDTFTRDLKDIFAVQDEIAGLIADQMQLKLGVMKKARVVDPEAYQLVLKGRHFWTLRGEANLAIAEEAFRRALEIDANFAEAHAGMADVWMIRAWYREMDDGGGPAVAEDLERATTAAQRATELDPSLAEPYATLGAVRYIQGRFAEVEALFAHAFELNPNYAVARHWYAVYSMAIGRFDICLEATTQASRLDPLTAIPLWTLATVLNNTGAANEAFDAAVRGLRLRPGFPPLLGEKALAAWSSGRRDEAIAASRAIAADHSDEPRWASDANAIFILHQTGHLDEAQRLAERVFATVSPKDYRRALSLAALGRMDEALNLGADLPNTGLHYIVASPIWDPVREDPRFLAQVEARGISQLYREGRATLERMRRQSNPGR